MQVSVLSQKVLQKEKEGERSKLSAENNIVPVSEGELLKISAKSNVFDSNSPHYNNACLDSSYGFEPDQSDLSQDEDANLRKSPGDGGCTFPKFEDSNHLNSPSNSCNVGFSGADHPFWSWSY